VKRISSRATFFIKFVTPLLAIAFLVWFWIDSLRSGPLEDAWVFLLFPLVIMLVWGFAYLRHLWPLADEVLDGGDNLLVRRRGVEQRVRFEDIINVSVERQQSGRRMVLRLARSGPFGDRIVFLPAMDFSFRFTLDPTNPMEEDLIRRVDAGRRKQGA
jgi:hypothetical protein